MGHTSTSSDITNGDLLIKVVIDEDLTNKAKRVGDDICYTLNLALVDAIFGCKKELVTIEGLKETVEISPGTQSGGKMNFPNRVKYIIIL